MIVTFQTGTESIQGFWLAEGCEELSCSGDDSGDFGLGDYLRVTVAQLARAALSDWY